MAYRLIVSQKVARKLGAIYDWGVQDSGKRAATVFVNKIYRQVREIKNNPYQYAVEPLLEDTRLDWRSVVAHPYFKIIFYIDSNTLTVFVEDIWDTRMDPEDLQYQINSLLK